MSEIKHHPSFGNNGDSLFECPPKSRVDQFAEIIKHSCPQNFEAIRSLTEYLESAISQFDPLNPVERIHKGIAEKSLVLVGYLDQLKYEDYRNLGGILSRLHDLPDITGLRECQHQSQKGNSPEVCQILATLEGIHKDLEDLYKVSKKSFIKPTANGGLILENPIQTIANDTISLMRLTCNQGVNTLQPHWTDVNACLDPNKPAHIILGYFAPSKFSITNKIFIDPADYNAEVTNIRFKQNHRYQTLELRDGESVFIGRNLRSSNRQIFKLNLVQNTVAKLTSAVQVDETHISRAGMRILKLDGIYIFNNLCRNACIVAGSSKSDPEKFIQVMHRGKYFPTRGGWNFGESQDFKL